MTSKLNLQPPYSLGDKDKRQFPYYTGRWIKPDKKEEKYFLDQETFLNTYDPKDVRTKLRNKTEYKIDPEKIIKYRDAKLEKIDELNKKALVTLMIDENNRYTQERTEKIFPWIKEVPEKYVHLQAQYQKELGSLLRKGKVETREELNTLFEILTNSEIVLPVHPLWDVDGKISALTFKKTKEFPGSVQKYALQKSIYNPFKFYKEKLPATSYGNISVTTSMYEIKALILHRLFPVIQNKYNLKNIGLIKAFSYKDSENTNVDVPNTDFDNKSLADLDTNQTIVFARAIYNEVSRLFIQHDDNSAKNLGITNALDWTK